jgi:hypothetical protein
MENCILYNYLQYATCSISYTQQLHDRLTLDRPSTQTNNLSTVRIMQIQPQNIESGNLEHSNISLTKTQTTSASGGISIMMLRPNPETLLKTGL